MNDLVLTPDFDLKIENGDFAIGVSNQLHQQCLLLSEKGGYKQYPTTGVGVYSFLKNENPDDLLREIRIQFSGDGMKVNRIGYEGGKLIVDADYVE